MADFIPDIEGDYDQFVDNFIPIVLANAAALGVSAAQTTSLQAKGTTWNSASADYNAKKTAVEAAATVKQTSRADLTGEIRSLVGIIQKFPATTDDLRRQLRINIAKETRTPVGVPTTFPALTIQNIGGLRHEIEFRDSATPTSKAKPAGVLGAQIYAQIGGTAPFDGAGMAFLGLDTKIPYTHQNEGADVGKQVFYCARWQNAKGEVGPWGPVVSPTVAV
ncbi:MAG TPA: hypothetical protein VGB45_08930 [Abditibacterium sp.]